MLRRSVFTLAALSLAVAVPQAQTPAAPAKVDLSQLKTTPEATDYKSTSTYDDVVKFMKAVSAAAPNVIHYTTYGTTSEKRPMPIAFVGTGLKDTTPASIKASGKLRVHIQGNIHAGEVEGKEAAQVLLREFAMGQHKDWLETTVFLITPIFNADGNEKFAMNNRGPQNGPINGQGTRANGQGLNINRDFMKMETPEARAFAKLWNDYDPHVGFDLHTSDGSTHGYYLTYAPGLNPDTSSAIIDIQKLEWFPAITKAIKTKYGWDTFYYGNVSGGQRGGGGGGGRGAGAPGSAGAGRQGAPGDAGRAGGAAAAAPPAGARTGGAPATAPAAPQGAGRAAGAPVPEVVGAPTTGAPNQAWTSFEHVPRYHNNYVGLRNRFALLSEAYAYATFKDRITATRYFVEEALNYASANADKLKKACAAADAEMLAGRTLATRAQIKRAGTVDIIMGEVEDETNPNNGARMNRRKDVTKVVPMIDGMWFEPTLVDTAATEYYLPASATKAIELLQTHGIKMRKLAAPVKAKDVEQFSITANTQRPANPSSIDTGTHGLRSLEGTWQAATADIPAGSYAISLSQPLGRLAFYLLAPTSDDGIVAWNFVDDKLGADAKTAPIWRKR